MVSASEIRDEGSLAEWLESRPPLDGVMISQRTVCRILPLYGAALARPWAREGNLNALTLLRLNLSSAALWHADADEQSSFPIPDSQAIRLAYNAASSDTDMRLQHVPDATLGAADVAFDARDGASKPGDNVERVMAVAVRAVEDEQDLWLQVKEDMRSLEEGRDLSSMPLWSVAEPEWFRRADDEMRAIWTEDNPKHWDFWLRWWKGVLSGRQLPWRLQAKVGQIAKEILDAGVPAVAAEIARIESRFSIRAQRNHTSSDRAALARNARAVRLQLDTLRVFVEDEIERLKGPNDLTEQEHAARSLRLEMLAKIVDAVALMREAFDEAEPSAANALVVVEEQLPAVVENAQAAADVGGDAQVSGAIVSMAAAIKHLTASGASAREATAIAFVDYCLGKLKHLFSKR